MNSQPNHLMKCPVCLSIYESGNTCPADGTQLVPFVQEDPLIGMILKETYRIDQRIGSGGMSHIYLGLQLSLNRKVAIKVLRPEIEHAVDFMQLFLREARTISQLNHPNIVGVVDFGHTDEGFAYLVMEYLEGQLLDEIVPTPQGLPLPNALWIIDQLIAGLKAAHTQDIVHRDLKPANIMLIHIAGGSSLIKLLDFGISKPLKEDDLNHTKMGMVIGTPGYMAPEQIGNNSGIDTRADIYALGALLYYLVVGSKPFAGETQEVILKKQVSELPPPITDSMVEDLACVKLWPVIAKAMAVNPQERYQTVDEMAEHLNELMSETSERTLLMPKPNAPTLFRLVFRGEMQSGADLDQAKATLKKTFKIDDARVEKLFARNKSIIKNKVDKKTAERYQDFLSKLGAISYIEEITESSTPLPATSPSAYTSRLTGSLTGKIQNTAPPPNRIDSSREASTAALETPKTDTIAQPEVLQQSTQPTTSDKPKLKWFALALVAILLTIPGMFYFAPDYTATLVDRVKESVEEEHNIRGIYSDRIVIGMSAAFSGAAKELGRGMKAGVQSRFNEENEKGGIHGRSLELIALDDGYEPDKAIGNLSQFLDADKGVFAMLGNVGTPTSKAVLPHLLESRTLLLGTFSGASLLRKTPPDRYVFNYRASYKEETAALVNYFVERQDLEPDSIAVFHQNDSFGMSGLTGVSEALHPYKVKPADIISHSYERNTAQVNAAVGSFLSQVDKIKAVIIVGTYSASALFTKQMKQGGYQGYIANLSFVGSQALAEQFQELGTEYGEGVIVSQVVPLYSSFASGVLKYRETLKKYYPTEQPGFVSLEGYIMASLFIAGMHKAGRDLTTETLVDALESIHALDVGSGDLINLTSNDHQGSHRVWGSRLLSDGSFEALEL